jgi:acyl-CoA synthetase (AMP-forming)/AMP-acid ligase II
VGREKRQREETMTAGATSGDRFRSWPEILANAARAAGGLRALGVAEDDSVALMLRNDFATFEVNMAAGQLGAYAVPINWHFTPEEAGYILADSRVAAACCTLSNLPFWDDFPHGFNRPKLEDQRARTLPIGDPASRLAYHLLRRARRPAFERVIFTAVAAVEWQA